QGEEAEGRGPHRPEGRRGGGRRSGGRSARRRRIAKTGGPEGPDQMRGPPRARDRTTCLRRVAVQGLLGGRQRLRFVQRASPASCGSRSSEKGPRGGFRPILPQEDEEELLEGHLVDVLIQRYVRLDRARFVLDLAAADLDRDAESLERLVDLLVDVGLLLRRVLGPVPWLVEISAGGSRV